MLLGPQFRDAIPIFAWLGIATIFQPFTFAMGWLLISQGRTREMFQWSIFASVVSVVSFVAGLPWGPVGVAACYVIASGLIHLPSLVYWTTRSGPVQARDLAAPTALPAALGSFVFVGLTLLRHCWAIGNTFVELTVCFTVAGAIWAAVMLATPPGQRWLIYYGKALVGK